MFVRKVKNRSGTISIQVISKHDGKYKVVKSFGAAKEVEVIKELEKKAIDFIEKFSGQMPLFHRKNEQGEIVEQFLANLSNTDIRTIGPELIFGGIFDYIGFREIKDKLFRYLVIARLAYPGSKLKTIDYLRRYNGISSLSVDALYKFLDKLYNKHKEEAEKIAFRHSKRRLKRISVVFYDVTTLYFETEDEDDLRRIGFSKDGKFQKPQILLGLLVGENGYPLGYDIFEGNRFEGKTLITMIKRFQEKYNIEKPIIIADAGLLSKNNISFLEEEGYGFIVGARIKSETSEMKSKILSKAEKIKNKGGEIVINKRKEGLRLIVSYSTERAKKDKYNRNRGIRRLKANLKAGRLTKKHINNRGYNKFLKLNGNITITIDEAKIEEDIRWDGLKGYITNTKLPAKKLIEKYRQLWQIEKAFRISKTDLRVRPIFHYVRRRIEAHICICFVAYAVWKELEYLLTKKGISMSVTRAAELTHNMYAIEYTLPGENEKKLKILQMDPEQFTLYNVIQSIIS